MSVVLVICCQYLLKRVVFEPSVEKHEATDQEHCLY